MSEVDQQGAQPTTDLKTQWLQALRSGAYEQAEGYLHVGNGFCCLGVLCNVVDPSLWSKKGSTSIWFWDHVNSRYLPEEISERFLNGKQALGMAMDMNDNGSSFAEIADYLEANL